MRNFAAKMEIIIKEGNLTITKDLGTEYPTAFEVLTAAYDIISRVFPQQIIIDAHSQIDPDSL